jgi:hypothetical protein
VQDVGDGCLRVHCHAFMVIVEELEYNSRNRVGLFPSY